MNECINGLHEFIGFEHTITDCFKQATAESKNKIIKKLILFKYKQLLAQKIYLGQQIMCKVKELIVFNF